MFFARRNIVATGVLLALGAAPLAVYAQASYYFNLPVQSLADSLRAVGSQGRVNVTFEPTAVQDRMAPVLRGNYSVQQALEHLLSGSGLILRTTEHGSFLVEVEDATNAVAPPSKASNKSFDFNIQSQNLLSTLRAITRTTGQRIDFDRAVISKKKADPVSGHLTAIDALQLALVGTGLHAAVTSSGAVTVLPGPGVIEQMPDVLVTATIRGLSATRMPTALKEIPQSVSVISQETLEQQNDFGLADALNHATGITVEKSTSLDSVFLSRGFYINEVHIDGSGPIGLVNTGGAAFSSPVDDLSEYDHIEVLRGADALFGGAGNPGATVNLQRKEPQAEPDASATFVVGSHNYYRQVLDATGPLVSSGALRGRVVASNTDQDYFYDKASRKQHKLYGTLQYDLTPSTMLTIGGSVEQVNAVPSGNGLPLYANGDDSHLPRSTSLTFPINRSRTHNGEAFAKLDQKFNDHWKLEIEAASLRQSGNSASGGFSSSINPVTDTVSDFSSSTSNILRLSNTASATLTGSFVLGGHRQEVVAGMDYSRQGMTTTASGGSIIGPPLNPWNFDPALYGTIAPASLANPAFTNRHLSYTKQIGGYAAIRLRFLENWSATVGARDNYYRGSSQNSFGGNFGPSGGSFSYTSAKVNRISTGIIAPYAGLTYDIGKQYSIYASYTDIYQPNFGVLGKSGALIPAIRGSNVELGTKAVWNHGLLNGSFALYKINQRNTPVFDPNTPSSINGNNTCCYLPGTNASKGIDAELSGQLTSAWQIDVGYTLNLNRSGVNLPPPPNGRQLLSTITPKHLLKIWTDYRLPGAANRWSLGGGITAQTSNYVIGSACTSFDSAGNCSGGYQNYRIHQGFHTVATLRAAYRMNAHLSAALNIENIFDRNYYQTQGSTFGGNWYGSPRSFMLTVKAQL